MIDAYCIMCVVQCINVYLWPQCNGNNSKGQHSTREWKKYPLVLYSTRECGGGEKMATVHRAYSTRESGGLGEGKKWPQYIGPTLQESLGEGEKMATVHQAYSTRECHSPKAGVESEFQGGDFCFYSSTCTAIAVLFAPILRAGRYIETNDILSIFAVSILYRYRILSPKISIQSNHTHIMVN